MKSFVASLTAGAMLSLALPSLVWSWALRPRRSFMTSMSLDGPMLSI